MKGFCNFCYRHKEAPVKLLEKAWSNAEEKTRSNVCLSTTHERMENTFKEAEVNIKFLLKLRSLK